VFRRSRINYRYLLHRVLTGAIATFGALSLLFFALYATGNPARAILPQDATDEQVQLLTDKFGFDQPVYEQFLRFLGNVLSGQLPNSFRYGENPYLVVLRRLPASVILGSCALSIGLLVGGLIGYCSAVGKTWLDRRLFLSVAIALDAIPTFFFGLILIFIFAITFGLLPASGFSSPQHMIMPVITLAASCVPAVARIFRSSVLETLKSDHIRAARARGVVEGTIAFRHVVLNSLGPTLTLVGIQSGLVLGGAIVTETIFAWPGIGQLTINAMQNKDFPLVIACVMVICVGFILATLIVDAVATIFEPKLRA
jgi:peptide/nickel transport system permease protein